jgi:hypothetical protein
MDLSGLAELKRLLHEAKTFSTVWDYFLTNFGEQAEFMDHGELVAEDELLQVVVKEVCKSLFPERRAILIRSRLIRIAEHHFVHGTIFLDDQLSGMLYFEDVHKGMMAVCWTKELRETKYVRFTGWALFEALKRSDN